MAYTHQDFTRMLVSEFPHIEADVRHWDGLLHLEMGEFARLMEDARERGDWAMYERGVRLADKLWSAPDSSVENALNVSFLEHLAFEGPHGETAWEMLTPALQRGWENMMSYLATLAASRLP